MVTISCKIILHFQITSRHLFEKFIPMVYASSASVYGDAQHFVESKNEKALNYYAYSKLLFDEYIRNKNINSFKSQIVGLRYFNVYGPYEEHKSRMASVIFHFYNQLKKIRG